MIFVTGASGFIGKHVVGKLLKENQEVIVLIRDTQKYEAIRKERIIGGTLENCNGFLEQLQKYKLDTCIHLAWEGIPDYSYEMSRKNLQYGLNLLELCRDLNIKHLIVMGSCWEYKNPHGSINEEWSIDYSNHFKAVKNSFRMICDAFCKEYGIRYNWLRLFYVYGTGQREGSLIPFIIREFSAGRVPKLNGAYNKNDFIHVSDVAEAVLRVVKCMPQEVVLNVGSGKATEVLDIVKLIGNKMNFEISRKEFPEAEFISNFWADITKGKKILDWTPEVSIEDGLKDYYPSSL